LASGAVGVAVLPPKKGEAYSLVLTEGGKLIRMKGARIQGVGVARFLESAGFSLAPPKHPLAEHLADLADIEEGTLLVERASREQAVAVQTRFAGDLLRLVSFDAEKPPRLVRVAQPGGGSHVSMDLHAGLSLGLVSTDYEASGTFGVSAKEGWLVSTIHDATVLPRNSEYGGPVELAAFIICAAGVATLDGTLNLGDERQTAVGAPFPRGYLRLKLANGDIVVVGISAVDELGVIYERAGQELYGREGMPSLRLGTIVGCIAAVIVRVRELDAAASAKTRKKRA
jgi:hypothetical protein